MTPNEWKERVAARYMARLPVTPGEAREMAERLFDQRDGSFGTAADYDPEACADEDLEG